MAEKIAFGAGCFWGVEHILKKIPGVLSTRCGYMGGKLDNPTYRDVCRGDTGHAEVVEVVFDAKKISLNQLLSYFWRLHDPTQLNRQGVDVGTQYRSAIFCYDEKQKAIAEQSKKEFDDSKVFSKSAVTQIADATTFFAAEDYHQDYFNKNSGHVCHVLRER